MGQINYSHREVVKITPKTVQRSLFWEHTGYQNDSEPLCGHVQAETMDLVRYNHNIVGSSPEEPMPQS